MRNDCQQEMTGQSSSNEFQIDGLQSIMTINQAIVNLREAAGESQESFAKKVGVSVKTVSNWENGRSPSRQHLRTLSQIAATSKLPLLAEFFAAAGRAALLTQSGGIITPRSSRRITVGELEQWNEWLDLIIKGAQAQVEYVKLQDFDWATKEHLSGVLAFHGQLAGYIHSELSLHLLQPYIRTGRVDWNSVSDENKARMLAPPDPEAINKFAKEFNRKAAELWGRTIVEKSQQKEEPGHQATNEKPPPLPPRQSKEKNGPKKRTGLGKPPRLPKPRENK